MHVQLPTGVKLSVTHIGSVQLYPNMIIENVLFIPGFKFNLLSVSRLMSSQSYCLVFLDNQCFIQERSSKTIIGYAKL